jgi:putative hydrolase of the HAD superfamily
MQNTRAICFDLFSTLISVGLVPEHVGGFTADILGVDRKHWNEACFGPLHEIRKPSQHLDNLRRMALSLDSTIPEQRIIEAVEARQARFDYALEHGVEAAVLQPLTRLKQSGYKLALVSNASSPEVQAWSRSPLSGLFDATVFSCETGYCKPEADIYHHTLALLGEAAEACLFVGDGGSDEHFGAARVGMKPVLISHYLDEADSQLRLQKYRDVIIEHITSLDELLDLVENVPA